MKETIFSHNTIKLCVYIYNITTMICKNIIWYINVVIINLRLFKLNWAVRF